MTILEAAERVMGRVVCPQVSEFFTREHERHGVRIECGAQVQALESDRDTCPRSCVATATPTPQMSCS